MKKTDERAAITTCYKGKVKDNVNYSEIESMVIGDFKDYLEINQYFTVPMREGSKNLIYFNHGLVSGKSELSIEEESDNEWSFSILTELSFIDERRDYKELLHTYERIHSYNPLSLETQEIEKT